METVESGKEDVVFQGEVGFDRSPQAIDGFLYLLDPSDLDGFRDRADERPEVLVLRGHLPHGAPQPVPQSRFHLPHAKPLPAGPEPTRSDVQYTTNSEWRREWERRHRQRVLEVRAAGRGEPAAANPAADPPLPEIIYNL
jgi:hypothetical protein